MSGSPDVRACVPPLHQSTQISGQVKITLLSWDSLPANSVATIVIFFNVVTLFGVLTELNYYVQDVRPQ